MKNIQYFTLDTLGILRSDGVHSETTTGLRKWSQNEIDKADLKTPNLLYYPWAIVETKHFKVPSSSKEYCHCQAVNASSAALHLREKLLNLAAGKIKTSAPIIAFPCIGPHVKL
jgi:hypothetical protein